MDTIWQFEKHQQAKRPHDSGVSFFDNFSLGIIVHKVISVTSSVLTFCSNFKGVCW